jgi:hypothetical protein
MVWNSAQRWEEGRDERGNPLGKWSYEEVARHVESYCAKISPGRSTPTLEPWQIDVVAALTGRKNDEATGIESPVGGTSDGAEIPTGDEFDIRRTSEYATQLLRLAATNAAREDIARAEVSEIEIPHGVTVKDLLGESDEPLTYRVGQLWPSGGRGIVAAARKAGKTTLTGNLARDLVDGGFLFDNPEFRVTPVADDAVVALLDFEMSRNMLRAWYRDIDIRRPEGLRIWLLRGEGHTFDIRDRRIRTLWAERLRAVNTQVFILDCLAPLLNALGISENSNSDVGPLLDAIDALLVEAEIAECLVLHHMGHTAERSRGASRLRDWPDVEWKLVRERDDTENRAEVDNGSRFFSAYGRDVDVDEAELTFSRDGRRLIMNGGRTREDARREKWFDRAIEVYRIVVKADADGRQLNTGQVKDLMKSTTNNTERGKLIDYACDKGWVERTKSGSSQIFTVGATVPVEALDGGRLEWTESRRKA